MYQETPTSYLDDGEWVTLALETAWMKWAGLQGYQRIRRISLLGERYTGHDITLATGHDYEASFSTPMLWSSSATDDLLTSQIHLHVEKQKCESIRVRIADAPPSDSGTVGTGRGLSLSGLAFEVGVKRGTYRVAEGQRR